MSSVKITLLASACLLATATLANADELKLSSDQLDTVTAGLDSLSRAGETAGGFSFFGPLNEMPEPEPEPAPPAGPTLPTLPGVGGGLQAFLQNLLGGGLFPIN